MISLRKARDSDCRLVFRWRNHPEVRERFFDPKPITYSEHEAWFMDSLKRNDRIILIASQDDCEVGVVRFDTMRERPSSAEVDIYVDPAMHGQGLGKKILKEAWNWLRKNTGIDRLVARVQPDNEASIRMFQGCGFVAHHVCLVKEATSDPAAGAMII